MCVSSYIPIPYRLGNITILSFIVMLNVNIEEYPNIGSAILLLVP